MTLSQLSLQTGRLAPAVATATALDPLVSVLLGAALLGETLHGGAAATVAAARRARRGDRGPRPPAAARLPDG